MKFNLGNIKVNGSPLTYFVELSAFLFILAFRKDGAEISYYGCRLFADDSLYLCAISHCKESEKRERVLSDES